MLLICGGKTRLGNEPNLGDHLLYAPVVAFLPEDAKQADVDRVMGSIIDGFAVRLLDKDFAKILDSKFEFLKEQGVIEEPQRLQGHHCPAIVKWRKVQQKTRDRVLAWLRSSPDLAAATAYNVLTQVIQPICLEVNPSPRDYSLRESTKTIIRDACAITTADQCAAPADVQQLRDDLGTKGLEQLSKDIDIAVNKVLDRYAARL